MRIDSADSSAQQEAASSRTEGTETKENRPEKWVRQTREFKTCQKIEEPRTNSTQLEKNKPSSKH